MDFNVDQELPAAHENGQLKKHTFAVDLSVCQQITNKDTLHFYLPVDDIRAVVPDNIIQTALDKLFIGDPVNGQF